ncbi:MAG: flagellar filament capping protein FliD [Granulosicoccus sp.]|nr:flagellar filament capping protein FliD [Granulosicoccus sp.]
MLTAAGVGSGIDIESILSQLDQIERQPVTALNQKREALDVELSAYGSVKSALTAFQTSVKKLDSNSDLGAFVASSDDEEVFTATSTGGQVPESVDIEVLSLATHHRLASEAYASATSRVAQGSTTFTVGDESFDLTIDDTNDTLEGMRDAINDLKTNNSVSASIINVDGGTRLVLTARNSGTEGEIELSSSGGKKGGGKKDGPGSNFSEITKALDASLIVHGFTVTSSSNSVSDVIEGITLDLKGTGTAHLESSRDTTSLRASVDDFVNKYNSMTDTLNDLSQSQLQGDQLPRGIDTRMRQAFQLAVDLGNDDSTSMLDMGFTFDRFGKLSINETKYTEALDAGVDRFVTAFSRSDTGLASRFSDLVDEYTKAGGVIDGREDGVDTRRSSIDNQIDRLEYRIEKTNLRLRRQFTAMDQIVTNLQSTSSFLASRLS